MGAHLNTLASLAFLFLSTIKKSGRIGDGLSTSESFADVQGRLPIHGGSVLKQWDAFSVICLVKSGVCGHDRVGEKTGPDRPQECLGCGVSHLSDHDQFTRRGNHELGGDERGGETTRMLGGHWRHGVQNGVGPIAQRPVFGQPVEAEHGGHGDGVAGRDRAIRHGSI